MFIAYSFYMYCGPIVEQTLSSIRKIATKTDFLTLEKNVFPKYVVLVQELLLLAQAYGDIYLYE